MKPVHFLFCLIAVTGTFCLDKIDGAFGLKFGQTLDESMFTKSRPIEGSEPVPDSELPLEPVLTAPNLPYVYEKQINDVTFSDMQIHWLTVNAPALPEVLTEDASHSTVVAQLDSTHNDEVIRICGFFRQNTTSLNLYDKIRKIAEALKGKYQCIHSPDTEQDVPYFVFKGQGGYLELRAESSEEISADYYGDKYAAWVQAELKRVKQRTAHMKDKAAKGL